MHKTRISVRGYETDALGHLNGTVYLQYAEHSRWSLMHSAGVKQEDLLRNQIAPVNLETVIRYVRELKAGEEVNISCELAWGERRSLKVKQTFYTESGDVAAEVSSIGGLIDLNTRHLIENPRECFRNLADRPEILGL
ncbi:acyl-CoA thioesterase [Streptomyces sp. NPDC057717]|uniref:acyl-CoA thioesterase n=1 Tax=Streptomyces sp. NPDC057717 TaxID=3346224 RepID=UPI0036AC89C6